VKRGSVKKVVLAYSGGLDTSIIIPWLKENYGGAEVVAFCGDVGQGDDYEAVKRKARETGASKCIVEDLREEFVRDYCYKALSAGAVYETATSSVPPWRARSSPTTRSRWPSRRGPTRSPTARPARATTRSASR
jgi:argininosuccinate synthase